MNRNSNRRLQNTLIFYIAGIVLFTNAFFAFTTIIRENENYLENAIADAILWGRLIKKQACKFLLDGNSEELDKLTSIRPKNANKIYITIYDEHWWRRWGDESRLPSGGFPALDSRSDEFITTAGVDGFTVREFYFPLATGGRYIGSIGIGIPKFDERTSKDAVSQVLLTMGVNVCLGLLLAVFVGRILLRPLNQLVDGLRAIRRGDFERRLNVTDGAEMTMVSETFNMMAASLQEKIRENIERTRALDEKIQELWEIYAFAKNLSFSLDMEGVFNMFLERAVTLSYSSYGQILLKTASSSELEVKAETSSFPCISKSSYDNIIKTCMENRETIQIQTASHILVAVPLNSHLHISGVLFLAKQGKQSYSEGIKRFLETLAPLAAAFIENARLYRDVVEMKEYVRNVLNSVESGVATFDEAGRLVMINIGFTRLLGIASNDANEDWRHLLAATGDENFCAVVVSMMDETNIDKISNWKRIQLTRPGLETRELQIRVSPLSTGKSVIGRVLVLDDVTDMAFLERRACDIEKWAVLGRLAASVAHEIRNPLVAVRSLVEIIGEGAEGEEHEHIRVILNEVDRLNKVIEQLLRFAKPEELLFQIADLREVCEDALILVRHEASKRAVNIVSNWPREGVYATIDRDKIKQALLNLILNAIQAMDGGGVVTVSLRDEKDMAVIEVTDTGHGVPADIAKKIFDPFFTTRKDGTGLGLSITQKVIDLHHGCISIISTSHTGTTFSIELPTTAQNVTSIKER